MYSYVNILNHPLNENLILMKERILWDWDEMKELIVENKYFLECFINRYVIAIV